MIRRIEANFGKSESIEIGKTAALQHADFIILRSQYLKPDMRSFIGISSAQKDPALKKKFREDLEKTTSKKAEFERRSSSDEETENKKISEATELVMLEMIEQFGSLGDQVRAAKTNDFDDFFNHVDAYAEIFEESDDDEEGVPLVVGFGFDFTTGAHDANRKIQENIKRIKMNRQQRPHLDYFISSKTEIDEHGNEAPVRVGYMEIVPIVIGLENRHAKELNYLFFQLKKASEEKKRFKSGPEFETASKKYLNLRSQILSHPVKRAMVEQITWQIGAYRSILDHTNSLDIEYLAKIDQLEDVIASLLPNMKSIDKNTDWENDQIHKRIRQECDGIKN